jgi:hypothetical protein
MGYLLRAVTKALQFPAGTSVYDLILNGPELILQVPYLPV